jgi:hypothetical protein
MSERKGDWIATHSGRKFWPLDPRPEEVSIGDVAHALSNLCRFGGHSVRFYSVAEHSVLVSYQVPPEHQLTALLHDAPEAYVADVPRPLKKDLANYAEIEALVWRAVAARFGLPEELPEIVKMADDAVLAAEIRWGIMPHLDYRKYGNPPNECLPVGQDPWRAKLSFMARFEELTRVRHDAA